MKNLPHFVLAMLAISMAPRAEAVEISMSRGNATSTFRITGPIEPGDAQRFKSYWEENAYDSFSFVIALDSPGGSLLEGLEMGRFIRDVGAHTEVARYEPDTPERYGMALSGAECYSACALAFMGGVERSISEGGTIGFHQFYGGDISSTDEAMELSQHVSALVAGYLRDMGAKPELFELLSGTSPDQMFVPTREAIASLRIVPPGGFYDFRLMPKDGLIVATATNEANPGSLERVYEIETLCWKSYPVINLYAESSDRGLSSEIASPSTTHIDGFRVDTDTGSFEFGSDRIRLYPASRLLASLFLEPNVARAVGSGNAWVAVNSYTASGVFMTGEIVAPPGGDAAIMASFRDCL